MKTIEIPSLGLCKNWPQPLNRGDRLIEVTFRVVKRRNFQDFCNWQLNRGWRFNTGLLNTGLTVDRTTFYQGDPITEPLFFTVLVFWTLTITIELGQTYTVRLDYSIIIDSNIATHAWLNDHSINFNGAHVIHKGNFCSRKTLESWHTAITSEADNNSKQLPRQYSILLWTSD